jgi:hypothetical protein
MKEKIQQFQPPLNAEIQQPQFQPKIQPYSVEIKKPKSQIQ